VVLLLLSNTGQEFDGSDSGAKPDEAVSWLDLEAMESTEGPAMCAGRAGFAAVVDAVKRVFALGGSIPSGDGAGTEVLEAVA
jgi:hypothetical protein